MVAFAHSVGARVTCDGFGLFGRVLLVAEQIEGPDDRPFYRLEFAGNGNAVPGRYDERVLAKENRK